MAFELTVEIRSMPKSLIDSWQGRVITPMSALAFFVAAKVHSVAAASARKRTQQVGDKGSSKEGRSSRDPRTTGDQAAATNDCPSRNG